MARVDGSLQSLLQGVSQQPPRERLPGQCTEQINMTSDPVDGLGRRAATQRIADMMNSQADSQWFMHIVDGVNRYFVCIYPTAIKVFDIDGVEQTVNSHSLGAYLTADKMSYVTLDDVTYLANPSVTPALLTDTREYDEGSALVFLLGGSYGRDYTITITYLDVSDVEQTITVTYSTPNGSSAAHALNIATEYIAEQLETALNAETEFPGTFIVERKSDVLYIRWTDTDEFQRFDVTVDDGDGGANMFSITDSTDNANRLPRFAPHNFVVKVAGADASEDDFWLEFLVTDIEEGGEGGRGDGFGMEGLWVETVSPGVEYKFDTATMPHTLVQEDDDTFTFAKGEWEDRRVGNEDSNSTPSFVGKKILGMSSFQNRLTMCAGSRVFMTRTDAPLDCWSQSATVQADDDPIDIGSTSQESSIMRKMVPHNRDLIVWSDNAQFIIFGRNSITPANSSLVLTATFEADLSADPVAAGRNVFFATNFGEYAGIQEFFTEGSADINDSRPTTAHASKYIVGTPEQMAATSNFSKLLVLTQEDLNTLYVYEYLWQGEKKAQSSWSKWEFPYPINFVQFVQNEIYIVGTSNSKFTLEKMDLDIQNDPGIHYPVKLDRKTWEPSVNKTFTTAYDIDEDTFVAVQGAGCPNPGMLATIESIANRDVILKRDMGGGTVMYGEIFTSTYIPTQPRVKDRDGVEVGTGELIVRHFIINFTSTGHIDSKVSSAYRDDQIVTFNGRILGAPTNVIGSEPVIDGEFIVPFGEETDRASLTLSSSDHTPMTLLDIEWKGQYNKRGRRITGGGS